MKMSVETHGFKEMLKKFRPAEDLYGPPVTDAQNSIADLGYNVGIAAAPLGLSGQTISHFQKRVQKKPVPLWVVVKTDAKRNGFAYPRVVNYSPYAQSRFRKGTNPHRYWFDNAMERVRRASGQIFDRALDEIERRWAQ